jgi:hypothetical protein
MASVACYAVKKAHRIAQAKGAHDKLIQAAHRVQADARRSRRAGAKRRRLADEMDAG